MLEGEGPDYRVPLAPCTPAELRGPGASNATVAGVPDSRAVDPGAARVSAPKPIPDNVTRAPLYLRKQDIACIETQLPKLTPSTQATMTIDLKACAVLP